MLSSQSRLEELVAAIRDRGCRLTPQRMAVLKILAKGKGHPSVEQIFQQIQADFPMISLATIYKTVSLLKDIGEITELSFGEEGHRYDAMAEPHPHLICIRCREIRDLDLDTLQELGQRIAKRTGYEIQRQRLDFFGICPQCQGSQTKREQPHQSQG